jgi:hypothetical protein
MPELTEEQGAAIARVRRAIAALVAAWPEQAAPLVATACAGALVDLLSGHVGPALVDILNQQWQGTPWQVTPRRGN